MAQSRCLVNVGSLLLAHCLGHQQHATQAYVQIQGLSFMCCQVTWAHSLHFWEPQLLPTLPSSCGVSMSQYRCKGPGLCRAHEDTSTSELLCFLSLGDQRGQAWQVNRLMPRRSVSDSPCIVVVSKNWAISGETGHPNSSTEGSPLPLCPMFALQLTGCTFGNLQKTRVCSLGSGGAHSPRGWSLILKERPL